MTINNPTILKYMDSMDLLEDTASVLESLTLEDGRSALILDRTIFYPQGGGQPYDQGTITKAGVCFEVKDVRFKDGLVYHIGTITEGTFKKDDSVQLFVDPDRRRLNNRNHTAGHIIDIALRNLGLKLPPNRGYHFPEGAYVEYTGALDEKERADLLSPLQKEVNRITKEGHPVSVKFVSYDQLKELSGAVPENIPQNKPTRAMIIGTFSAIPCGGTHVSNTAEIDRLNIVKIKNKKGNVRISYAVN